MEKVPGRNRFRLVPREHGLGGKVRNIPRKRSGRRGRPLWLPFDVNVVLGALLRPLAPLAAFFAFAATLTMLTALALDPVTIARRLLAMSLRMRREVAGRQHLDELARRGRQLAPALVD